MSGIVVKMPETLVYKICIPHTLRDSFDYSSNDLSPVVGARVWVPFRQQKLLGIILGIDEPEKSGMSLKSIAEVIDHKPFLPPEIMALCQWVGRYYQSPLSEVIPLAMPKKFRQGALFQLPLLSHFTLNVPVEQAHALINKRSAKKHALIDLIATNPSPVIKATLSAAGFNKSHWESLIQQGLLTETQVASFPHISSQKPSPPLILNEEQSIAVQTIANHLHHYHCFLLQGVTGSGKTEVYLQLIAKVLANNKQVLVLVPEIGLTPQLLARFSERFAVPMAVIHSHLNETERANAWCAAYHHQVKLIIGTRAAIFTPLPSLGLIIIDEEHDNSLKQMDGVRYSARDTALIRAQKAKIPIVLGTATPSLESLYNCQQQKYSLLPLTQKALTSIPLHYQILDLRNQRLQEGFAAATINLISEHLQRNNQVLVFINRRGFAPVLLCHHCGWMVDCRACDSHLTFHRQINRLICHHCGLNQALPTVCKSCHSKELIPLGVGTQRVYEHLKQIFPEINILRIDRDEVRKKNQLENHLNSINQGQAQLIVGTQMLAKGHHFPNLTLVVVLDADAGFYNQDFRAIEQLGQLLIQVAGRAGRAQQAGQVLIQTHLPQHPLLNLLTREGYEAFAKALLLSRQEAALPPYHYLAVIRAQDRKNDRVLHFLQTIKNYLSPFSIQTLGPAPAPLARKANEYRMQLLLKAPSRKLLQSALTTMREWLTINKISTTVRWNVDVDPQDLS